MSREVSPVATFRTWLTTTEGLRTERTPEADSRTSRGVVASGVIWLSTVSAAADSEVRSEDVAGSVVGPLLASLLAVSAITSKFESARLRSDCAALSSTWPALFSAVPTGVAASCPFATGLTAPDSSSSTRGLMVFARVVALETICLRSTAPSAFDSSLVRLSVAVARPGRSA